MTAIKVDGKLSAAADAALELHATTLYARPGIRIVGVVELAHVERTQPAPDEDKEPSVKLRVMHLEVANDQQERAIRGAMQALYLHRTARGTLSEHGEVELSERTLEQTEGLLHAIEAARMRAALGHFSDVARQSAAAGTLSETDLRRALREMAKRMDQVLAGVGSDG